MNKTSSDVSKSVYVSCIKINGKPVLPPLMTPERRAEMFHYKQLAVALEAHLQSWTKKDWSDETISEDSSVTVLSGTEHSSSNHHFCTNRKVDTDVTCEVEPTLVISGDSASLNNAIVKQLMLSNELEETVPRATDLRSESTGMLESFQHDTLLCNPVLVTNVIHHDCSSEVENDGQCIKNDVNRERSLCSGNKDFSVQDSKSEDFVVNDDIKDCGKCDLENMERNPGLIHIENIFSFNCTGFRPWKKVYSSGTSKECDTVFKPCQGNDGGLNGNQQQTKQVATDSDVNGNLLEGAEYSLLKSGNHNSFVMPLMQNAKQNLTCVFSDTDDYGHNCRSSNNALEFRTECLSYKECISQDQNHSKNLPDHVELQTEVNSTFLLHNEQVTNPNMPVQNIPHFSKETDASENISKPADICEAILDISGGLKSCSSEDCVRFNSLQSDRNVVINRYISSGQSSPGCTELSDVTSGMPHLLIQENMEDSVSSAAMTSSTDLNHYMNVTGSSGSGSPGQDVTTLYSSKLSGQDVLHNTSDVAAHERSLLSPNSDCGQDCSESNLISHHSSLTDQKAQESTQNIVDKSVGTSIGPDSVCVVEKFVVQGDSSDELKVICPVNVESPKNVSPICRNKICDVAKPAESLNVPKLKLQCNMSLRKNDALATTASQVSGCVQDSNNTEKNLNAVSRWDILKPETPPPRLVRQNSYTLDTPSPLLVAHIEMQKEKNSIYDMTGSVKVSPKPCRKAWDLTKARHQWKPDGKKGNLLFAVLDEKAKPSKKTKCDVAYSSRHAFMAACQDRHISSLPASNASSPIKILTPSASLDSLPSATSIESVKILPQPSILRQNKYSCIGSTSSTASKVTNRSRTPQKKSPASNTTRSTKLLTPSALVDFLPSVSSTNTMKNFSQPSSRMKNKDNSKCSIFSTPTKQSSSRSRISPVKSPTKILRKDLPVEDLSVTSQDNLKKISDFENVPSSSQQNIRRLILHMQSQHHQQMADLLAKQRLEQEKLREAFLQQQEELMLEIRKVYSAAFCASESQKVLVQETPSCDYLASHENRSFNSSINPFCSGSSSKSLSFESSGSSDTSTHDVPDKCILSDTDFKRFVTSNSVATGKGQTMTGIDFYEDSVLDEASLNGTTANLLDSTHETVSVEEVPQNPSQNCSRLILSDPNSTERYLQVDSSHPSAEALVPPQLDILQKHNSDCDEENTKVKVDTCNVNCAVPLLSSVYPGTMSSVKTSGDVSLPGTENLVIQRTEVNFSPSSICNSPPLLESGRVEVNEKQSNSIKGHSPCIRQLFPPHVEEVDVHHTPPLNLSELEQIAAIRITAVARGFLTRRLLRTARVQDLIVTIRDSVLCAVKVHQDFWSNITPEDVALHGRLIQQVTAACHNLHAVFFNLSTSEQMAIIATDRDRLRNKTARPNLPRPLSAATRRSIERKMLQIQGDNFARNRPASADCILHRRKSTGSSKHSHSGISEVGQSSLLKQQQRTQPMVINKLRHSLNVNSGRRPWR